MAFAGWQLAEGGLWITRFSEVFENLEMAAPVHAFPRYLAIRTKEINNYLQTSGRRLRREEKLRGNAAQLFVAIVDALEIVVLTLELLDVSLPLEKNRVIIEESFGVLSDRAKTHGQGFGIRFCGQPLRAGPVALQFQEVCLQFFKLEPSFDSAVARIQLRGFLIGLRIGKHRVTPTRPSPELKTIIKLENAGWSGGALDDLRLVTPHTDKRASTGI